MDKKEQLYNVCKKFIEHNRISCDEAIAQCDWVIENAYDLIGDICNIVGFYEDDEEC